MASQTPVLSSISTELIFPSKHNPRKHCDEAALKELAASIREHGIRQPLVLRSREDASYEIVVGERRWRAAQIAELDEVPAIVDDNLSDREALEIMVIENLQREDIHPLEEALSYESLLRPDVKDEHWEAVNVDTLAEKVGKSKGYIYARIKLLQLLPAAREAFEEGHITAGHAVLIARLQPREQIKALGACFHYDFVVDGLLKDTAPQALTLKEIVGTENNESPSSLRPEKSLREWIQENVNLELKTAPWDLEDADLVEEAGACSACPKRSSSNPNLFQELAVKGKDTCFDPTCYHEKQKAYVQRALALARSEAKDGNKAPLVQLSEQVSYTRPKEDQKIYKKGQWVEAKVGSCPEVVKALIVRGENAGLQVNVCCDPDCKTHKKEGLMASSSSSGPVDYDVENFKRHKSEAAAKKKAFSQAVLLKEILGKVGARIPVELLRVAADEIYNGEHDGTALAWLLDEKWVTRADLEKAIAKSEGAALNRLLGALACFKFVRTWGKASEYRAELISLAKALGIKGPDKILTKTDEEQAEAKQCRACKCTEQAACQYYDGEKQVACGWVPGEDGEPSDLCSHPLCVKMDAKKKKAKDAATK